MAQYFATFLCSCGVKHKCQIKNDFIEFFPTENCKIDQFIRAFGQYKCIVCGQTKEFGGNPIYHFTMEIYKKLNKINAIKTKEDFDKWMDYWESHKGSEALYYEATEDYITKDYRGYEYKEGDLGSQVWNLQASYFVGEGISKQHFPPNAVVCESCAKDIDIKKLWIH